MYLFFVLLNTLIVYLTSIAIASVRLKWYKVFISFGMIYVLAAGAFQIHQIVGIMAIVITIVILLFFEKVKLLFGVVITLSVMISGVVLQSLLLILLSLRQDTSMINGDNVVSDEAQIFIYITMLILMPLSGLIIGRAIHKKNNKTEGIIASYSVSALAVAMVLCFIAIYLIALTTNIDTITLIITSLAFLLFLMLLGIISFVSHQSNKKAYQLEQREMELNQLTDYTNKLEAVYNDMRRIRHDYVNVLTSMTGYMEADDMAGLIHYFGEKITPFSKRLQEDNTKLGRLANLKQVEVKGIVSSKIFMVLDKEVDVFIDIADSFQVTSVDMIDLCRILGILLDNAIEATLETEGKKLEIGFINKGNSKIILVANTCRADIDPLFKLSEEGYSTKGRNRGIGLSNLKGLLDQYDHVSNDVEINQGVFKQLIEIREM